MSLLLRLLRDMRIAGKGEPGLLNHSLQIIQVGTDGTMIVVLRDTACQFDQNILRFDAVVFFGALFQRDQLLMKAPAAAAAACKADLPGIG